MPVRVTLPPTLGARLAASDRALFGAWVCSGSALNAEILAGSGLDVVVIDAEHSPNDLHSILAQLHAVSAYPVTTLVRPPIGDPVLLKQYLDLGVQNLVVPMVDSVEQAEAVVRAVRYPPHGVRGIGSALARSARWSRIDGYLADASSTISLFVQIESAVALDAVEHIVAVDGVDGILVGPADLAGSLGHLGQQDHAEVVEGVLRSIRAANAVGKPAAVNAFAPAAADRYAEAGAALLVVGADVTMLARASEALAERYLGGSDAAGPGAQGRASY